MFARHKISKPSTSRISRPKRLESNFFNSNFLVEGRLFSPQYP